MKRGGARIPTDSSVIGLLFGVFNENKALEIMDATEAIYSLNNKNVPVLNLTEIEKKKQLWITVYANYELVGWYSGGSEISDWHMEIHQHFGTIITNPIFLLMNATINNSNINNSANSTNSDGLQQLPLSLYHCEKVNSSYIFLQSSFKLHSSPYESVAIDSIVKATPIRKLFHQYYLVLY